MAQYYLSGAVAARVDGTPAALGGPKQRCVLAVLLANHGTVVSIDRLIDAVWGDEPPPKALASVRSYVANLRRVLDPGADVGPDQTPDARRGDTQGQRLASHPHGYQLNLLGGDTIDLVSFESLVSKGRTALIRHSAGAAVEMLTEVGYCSGIENYSRHLTGLAPGQPPYTLMDYFGDDFLLIIDESHKTVPQVGGMYAGDQSRKQTLVDYGFRLPSAKDNRPLSFDEFENKLDQVMFVSATPGEYEYDHELLRAEQIIRPTGLLDPKVEVRPIEGQIDDLVAEVNKEIEKKNKVLITTLTKRMAEDLTDYMKDLGIRVRYLHSDIDTLERAEIIRDMRLDVFDVLVGINLLREGLDIPEITLVAILDADKEGFLRSETSLVQTIGRAARNSEGHVIMYADNMTESMEKAISETERRRAIQEAYNREHGITPTTIKKAVRDLIAVSKKVAETEVKLKKDPESMNRKELTKVIAQVEKQMRAAAADLNFEQAAELRDKMLELKKNLEELTE